MDNTCKLKKKKNEAHTLNELPLKLYTNDYVNCARVGNFILFIVVVEFGF